MPASREASSLRNLIASLPTGVFTIIKLSRISPHWLTQIHIESLEAIHPRSVAGEFPQLLDATDVVLLDLSWILLGLGLPDGVLACALLVAVFVALLLYDEFGGHIISWDISNWYLVFAVAVVTHDDDYVEDR